MSSYVGGDVTVAPVVAAGATVAIAAYATGTIAYGIGYGVYKVGEAFVNLNNKADEIIEENKKKKEEEQRQRMILALSAQERIKEMEKVLKTEVEEKTSSLTNSLFELATIKNEFLAIDNCFKTSEVEEIEYNNMVAFSKLSEILNQINHLLDLSEQIGDESTRRELLKDMKQLQIVVASSIVSETRGKSLILPSEESKYRARLNERLVEAASRIVCALDYFDEMEKNTGIPKASRILFSEKLLGIDKKIERLLSVDITNEDLEKGVLDLEESVEFFETLYPSLLKEKGMKEELYKEYIRIAEAFNEKKKGIKEFNSYKDIEDELKEFEKKNIRAEKCQRLYKKMGKDAYICYAIDTELSKLGYTVQNRERIKEIVGENLEHGKMGEKTLPFYLVEEGELTQFYQVSSNCILQLIVHEDGSISMQTISDHGETESIKVAQKKHCTQLSDLKRKLRENWFILLDNLEEEDEADVVTEIEEWRNSNVSRKNLRKKEEKWKNTNHMYIQNN